MAIKVSAKELLASGAHFGHQARRWNPKMAPYLYGVQDGVHVFDLIKTKELLEEALKKLREHSIKGSRILLLGTKKQVKDKIAEVATEAGCFYVNERWLGGTITNFPQIKKSLDRLKDMKSKKEKGEYNNFTKKERLLIDREITRLEGFFGGISELEDLPEILFIVDTKREAGAAKEARSKGIETIGIVDSNCDPTLIDYPIPMNDDATKALEYVLALVGEAIKKRKKSRKSRTSSKNETDKSDKKTSTK